MRVVLSEGGDLEVMFAYDERLVGIVKTLSERRFDNVRRLWIVPAHCAREAVEALRPHGFSIDPQVEALAASASAAVGDRANDLTVLQLNQRAARALAAEFGGALWVVGELAEISRARRLEARGGPLRFHLVQRDAEGAEVARVAAVLFESSHARIAEKLTAAGNPFELADEAKVRVRARAQFYPKGGSFQILVDDLDVEYTLGDVARRREETIRRLVAEGLDRLNPSLPVPMAPLRVGLATRFGSDAYHDVFQTLRDSGYAFHLLAIDVRVQGREAERTLLEALDAFERRGDLDVVLVCRGGGSRLDLAAFDSEAIARAVAALPIPVVVGVGHEQDRSVLDTVARNCRTPALAAQWLVEEVRRFEETLSAHGRAVADVAKGVLADRSQALSLAAVELVPGARALLRRERSETGRAAQETARLAGRALGEAGKGLDGRRSEVRIEAGRRLQDARGWVAAATGRAVERTRAIARSERREHARLGTELAREARGRLRSADQHLDAAAERIALSDPKRVLERGYAILRKTNRRVVRSPGDVERGERLVAHLAEGNLAVTSEGPVDEVSKQ